MARILYLGCPSDVDLSANATVSERLKATGNNTGNLLIGHAVKRHLRAETVGIGMAMDPRFVEENFDRIVIGASNFIFGGFDFGSYARFLEGVRLPCVIIGLGAQAPGYGSRIEVPAGTRRMLDIISERSTSLGVRGYFTAAKLIDMGVRNVRVVGCPSMYWTRKPTLRIKRRETRGDLALAVNGSVNVVDHSVNVEAAKRIEGLIARLSFARGCPYILQNEGILMELAAGTDAPSEASLIRSLRSRYGLADVSPELFVQFVRKQMRCYFSVESWMAGIETFDFVLGSRFHGCWIALLAGVPACVFVHDTRTREMCELLRIPHVPVATAGDIDVEALYESLDLEAMEVAYRYLFRNYVGFLEENGVEHCLETEGDEARSTEGIEAKEDARYYERLRGFVAAHVPPGARVLVVSKGDTALLEIGERVVGHFPQGEQGQYLGFNPSNDDQAIDWLERLRARGAEFLFVPYTAGWWLDYYGTFARHLEGCYRRVAQQNDGGIIFDLRGVPPPQPPASAEPTVRR